MMSNNHISEYITEHVSIRSDEAKEFFSLVKNTQSLNTQTNLQILWVKFIASLPKNTLHVLKDTSGDVAGGYLLSEFAYFIQMRPENWFSERGENFTRLQEEGYKYLSYELIKGQDHDPESLVPLLCSVQDKVYTIVTDEHLEIALLENGWQFVLQGCHNKVPGRKNPHLSYIKYDPET